jgi:hypothetical protein
MEWTLLDLCLLGIAMPASTVSLLGHACARRQATKTYVGAVVALCFAAVVAWTYQIYLGNGPTHYEPIGPEFVASLLIFPSMVLGPAALVYPCVSGAAPTRHILPIAFVVSIVALPFWLWIAAMVLHYVVGGM